MRRVHVFIMGFQQDWSKTTGIELIWKQIRKLSSQSQWVLPPLPWNVDWEQVAGLICRHTEKDAEVQMYGFSWGCGYGSVTLAKELAKRGRRVKRVVWCDPIYKNPMWGGVPSMMDLLNYLRIMRPEIKVPSNIDEVHWLRQSVGCPCANDLRENGKTMIFDPVVLDVKHEDTDNSQEMADMCWRVATAES